MLNINELIFNKSLKKKGKIKLIFAVKAEKGGVTTTQYT